MTYLCIVKFDNSKILIDKFRKKRKEKKIKIGNVAELSGVSRETVSRFEHEKASISFENFLKLVKAIDCKIIIVDNDE